MNLTETQLSSEPIFDGKFVTIARDTVRLPNGNQGYRIVIRHPGAACVLAVTEADEVVLVRQWRYATGQALLELPAGKLDPDEDPAVCAARELEEETPYRAQSVRLLHTFYTAPGFCNEKMYLYLAEGITPTSTRKPDQDEFVETVLLSRQAVREAVAANQIQDGKTLVGLQYWLLNSPSAD
ncbi:NUDIX hydrolase [Eikenella halliae]|uniref:GDP-mannose pyrophosphatase n=1 Tax=Eikenella halliae TaxID=1795832 RepID=A0A1B6VWK6_9NEIS|nr:NUDIX hydrolase [Eikenella halliae]OAM38627.1 ADP-ribose pyrophosphatase [Eikenella halliae]